MGVHAPIGHQADEMQTMSARRREGVLQNRIGAQFAVGGNKFYTIRATARIRKPNGGLSELRRSASLTVMLSPTYDKNGYRILDARSGPAVRPLEETWPW